MRESDNEPTVEELVLNELRMLRKSVVGVRGSMVATSDGLLIAHDVHDMEPTRVAAIVATTLGLARQAMQATGRGELREAVARGSAGYLAAYAAGHSAVVAVIGGNELNVAMLHYEMRDTIERIAAYSAEFARWASPRTVRRELAPDA
jgi:predicted regulator of Ras-like GTPase activity (Roadblock/LC7/MglB family)